MSASWWERQSVRERTEPRNLGTPGGGALFMVGGPGGWGKGVQWLGSREWLGRF
ncbi:hypothetical protein GCM10009565_01980 [Amycolatopsis albidoflavus]